VIKAINVRKGQAVIYNDEIHIIEDQHHMKPGKGKAFMQISLRNMKSGKIFLNKFSPDDSFEQAPLISKDCQYLYGDADGFHFMDLEDYHSFALSNEMVGDNKHYLKEEMELSIRFHEANPLLLELPSSINLKVVQSEPGIRGDTATKATKIVHLETGYEVKVPLFINEGDVLKIDTRTGEYLSRA